MWDNVILLHIDPNVQSPLDGPWWCMNFQFSPWRPHSPQHHWDIRHTTVLGEGGFWEIQREKQKKTLHCFTMSRSTWNHPASANACKRFVSWRSWLTHMIKWTRRLTLCAAKHLSSLSSAFVTYSRASNTSCFFRSASMLGRRDRSRDARASLHRNSASSLDTHTP